MEIDDKLKKFIFKRLTKDLSHVEVITSKQTGSIWLIDRDEKYWYLQLYKNDDLWYRMDFFENFFRKFSFEESDYEPIIKEWVEQVLNRNVKGLLPIDDSRLYWVEYLLNSE
jgi:hypothetical protein